MEPTLACIGSQTYRSCTVHTVSGACAAGLNNRSGACGTRVKLQSTPRIDALLFWAGGDARVTASLVENVFSCRLPPGECNSDRQRQQNWQRSYGLCAVKVCVHKGLIKAIDR